MKEKIPSPYADQVRLPDIRTEAQNWSLMQGSGCQRSTSVPSGRCLGVCACATVEYELEESHGANDLDSQAHGCEKGRGGWNGLHLRAPVSGVDAEWQAHEG